MEWGNNFSPELSYKHPDVVIEEWANTVLIIPTTSTPAKVAAAYHPTDNPSGKWYLNNAKIMSKARITSVSGTIAGNLSDDNNVFREIRKTMIQNFFSKEWIEHQKLVQAYEKEQGKIKYYRGLMINFLKKIKCLNQQIIIMLLQKNEKSEETNLLSGTYTLL